jgi:Arc/MetJ family transcription regulator
MSRPLSPMTSRSTSVRLNRRLVNEAARSLGAKSRTEAVRLALQQIVGPRKSTVPEEREH